MSGVLKNDREYIILTNNEVAKIKVLDVTQTSIRVHNLDDDFIKRYLLEDYNPRVLEEIGVETYDQERTEILEAVTKPIVEIEHPTKALILGKVAPNNARRIAETVKSNAERLAEILSSNKKEEVDDELPTVNDKEVWKEILNLGHPYMLSNKGKVKNHHNKVLKPTVRGTQQYYLLVNRDKTQKCVNVSTLLKEVFGLTKVV
jgi:hypothetical protein